jgi:hypothetical protein
VIIGADRVWYAAYGSNMDAARFACYLQGGRPAGGARTYEGARDRSPPADVQPLILRGSVYFAWQSPVWGGGIAFFDPHGGGTTLGRAYLVTTSQMSDVVAQEMRRPPVEDLDLTELLESGSSVHGPGRYESLHVVGEIDGLPAVTFTASWAVEEVTLTPPSAAYLTTMAAGIRAGHDWNAAAIADYLLGCDGVSIEWTRPRLLELIDAQP